MVTSKEKVSGEKCPKDWGDSDFGTKKKLKEWKRDRRGQK